MQEITLDRGLKSFEVKDIDGTVIGTVRFNPADLGLAGRFEEARRAIAALANDAGGIDSADDLIELDRKVREQFDYAFGNKVSDVLFAGVSPFAVCDDGALLAEKVLEAFAPMIEQATEAALKESKNRAARRAEKYQKDKAAGLAPGQTL